jgi:DNA-directed RNA polymerase specialized sigma subunit
MKDMATTARLVMAVGPQDLPVDTRVADAEIAAATASQLPVYAGRSAPWECFTVAHVWPVLSAEAQRELVAYHQTTMALRGGVFADVRLGSRRKRLIQEHLTGDDERTAYLVGSVFRLVKSILTEQPGANAQRTSDELQADLFAEAYATVLEAVGTFDPARRPVFASWVTERVGPVVRRTRQHERFSVHLGQAELRMLRRMQVAQYALTTRLGREPSRPEIYREVEATSTRWNYERAAAKLRGASAAEVKARMIKSGESAMLTSRERMEEIAVHLVSTELHLEDMSHDNATYDERLDSAYIQADTPETHMVESDRTTGLLAFAFAGLSDDERVAMASQFGLDDATSSTAVTSETRALMKAARNRLGAPHAQYCWLAGELPGQFADQPEDVASLVQRRTQLNQSARVLL